MSKLCLVSEIEVLTKKINSLGYESTNNDMEALVATEQKNAQQVEMLETKLDQLRRSISDKENSVKSKAEGILSIYYTLFVGGATVIYISPSCIML